MGPEADVTPELDAVSGTKHDDGKARFDLIPVEILTETARVFAFGARKYDDRNWELGISFGRLYAALQRHLNAFWDGEDEDPESGLSHLGHAMCCLMMMGEMHLNARFHNEDGDPIGRDGTPLDDRP